jgi:dTDP-4-amino-4,6-dideoxygalactose transaminase
MREKSIYGSNIHENPIKKIKTSFDSPATKEELEKLSEAFSAYAGVKYAYPVSSFSAALLISFYTLNLNFESQVALSALNFAEIPGCVEFFGCRPVFIDIDLANYNANMSHLELMSTSNLKAVIASHMYGAPCAIDAILEASAIYKFFVIEDASTSLGAVYKGIKCGSRGHISLFNFDSSSIINCGSGAIVATSNEKINSRLKLIFNAGYDANNELKIPVPEFRMSNEKARMINEHLKHIDALIDYKYMIAKHYRRDMTIKHNDIRFIEQNSYSLTTFNYLPALVENRELYNKITKILAKYPAAAARRLPVLLPMAHYYKKNYDLLEENYKNSIKASESVIFMPNDYSVPVETIENIIKDIKGI